MWATNRSLLSVTIYESGRQFVMSRTSELDTCRIYGILKNAADGPHVKCIDACLEKLRGGPCFAAVHQDWNDIGLTVDCDNLTTASTGTTTDQDDDEISQTCRQTLLQLSLLQT